MEFIDGDPTERLRARSEEVHNFWVTFGAHHPTGWDNCMEQPCRGDRVMIAKIEAEVAEMAGEVQCPGCENCRPEDAQQQSGCPEGPHIHATQVYAMGLNGEPVEMPPELKRFLEGIGFGGRQR